MALTTSEVARIKYELGYNVLTIGALPYVGYMAIFDEIVSPYMQGGAETTSTTAVTAATTATPATITLASSTGFAAGDRIVVDVDEREETVTVQSITGSTITALFHLAHSGTYPVIVEGGESIVRAVLRQIRTVWNQMTSAVATAGLKKVDVIEFYGSTAQTTQYATLGGALERWRDELALALGVPNLRRIRRSAGSTSVLY